MVELTNSKLHTDNKMKYESSMFILTMQYAAIKVESQDEKWNSLESIARWLNSGKRFDILAQAYYDRGIDFDMWYCHLNWTMKLALAQDLAEYIDDTIGFDINTDWQDAIGNGYFNTIYGAKIMMSSDLDDVLQRPYVYHDDTLLFMDFSRFKVYNDFLEILNSIKLASGKTGLGDFTNSYLDKDNNITVVAYPDKELFNYEENNSQYPQNVLRTVEDKCFDKHVHLMGMSSKTYTDKAFEDNKFTFMFKIRPSLSDYRTLACIHVPKDFNNL